MHLTYRCAGSRQTYHRCYDRPLPADRSRPPTHSLKVPLHIQPEGPLPHLFTTTSARFEETASFVRVWRNECLRVFYDRLTNDKDRAIVSDHISELLQEHFQEQAEVCFTLIPTSAHKHLVLCVHVCMWSFQLSRYL